MQESQEHRKKEEASHQSSKVANHNNIAIQLKDHRPVSSLQKVIQTYNTNIQEKQQNNTGLPHNLKSGVEALSGHSLNDVKVHYNSSKPAQLNAHAFAQGTQIHLASGQEKHLAHEAWHVVQQKQGRVQPTAKVGGVNINNSSSLEKEADLMGEKSLKHVAQRMPISAQIPASASSSNVVQRVPVDVAVTGITHLVFLNEMGSLYEKKFRSNELMTVKEGDYVEIESTSALRSRRGPNQEVAKNNSDDETGPQWYVWYLVKRVNGRPVRPHTYIREDTFRRTTAHDERRMPIRSTIYGLDKGSAENIKLAYEQGYRDFDCAYSYHKGKTPQIFRSFRINQGPVRLIYKFKFAELDAAWVELQHLVQVHGVLIHTIMLHDIPAEKRQKETALRLLKDMASRLGAKVGLSNVVQDNVESEDNLTSLLRLARQFGIQVSSVQNRISPSAPDEAVREVCAQHGISYMGFGLKGGDEGGHGGTCEMGSGSAVENYSITEDPLFLAMAQRYGLKPDELRHVMLDWGRAHGIHVISQSRSSGGMHLMRSAFPPALLNFLRIYGHGNRYYPLNPSHAPPYQPFEMFCEAMHIHPAFMRELYKVIPLNLWRLYYKHTLVREKEGSDFVQVMSTINIEGMKQLIALNAEAPASSVTDLANLFLRFKSGVRAGASAAHEYPVEQTNSQLFVLASGLTNTGKAKYLVDEDFSPVASEESLAGFSNGKILHVLAVSDVVATYKKTGDNKWERQ